jgi:hypothetical protein
MSFNRLSKLSQQIFETELDQLQGYIELFCDDEQIRYVAENRRIPSVRAYVEDHNGSL